MSTREFIFDQLPVLLIHAAFGENIVKITQCRGNTHQRNAEMTQIYFDCVEEPDGTHCQAPFLVRHSTYLIGNNCERNNRIPNYRMDALPFGIEKKRYAK